MPEVRGRSIELVWVRQAFFRWLFPAAFLLPLWLLIGWIIFDAGGWALVLVLFIAMPSVFVGQLGIGLLIRARPSVRGQRAVSWLDVLGLTIWHGLTIVFGLFNSALFLPILLLAIATGIAVFWSSLAQLWQEAREGASGLYVSATTGFPQMPNMPPSGRPDSRPFRNGDDDVIVIRENPRDDD